MYDIPSKPTIKECVISEDVVQGNSPPVLVYEREADWA
jgi:ATP-dependent protease Clp ATPase subunit